MIKLGILKQGDWSDHLKNPKYWQESLEERKERQRRYVSMETGIVVMWGMWAAIRIQQKEGRNKTRASLNLPNPVDTLILGHWNWFQTSAAWDSKLTSLCGCRTLDQCMCYYSNNRKALWFLSSLGSSSYVKHFSSSFQVLFPLVKMLTPSPQWRWKFYKGKSTEFSNICIKLYKYHSQSKKSMSPANDVV